ncbi:MAG: phosphomannomutase/phosphoglucomutase [Eubacteriales bacterium]|nr:phosphomannomutase/phosphoglucomutase [Eubacteriales bacterium]
MDSTEYMKLQNGSDIRGVALSDESGEAVNLTPETAARIASGFLIWLSGKTRKQPYSLVIAIGRDPRLSGQEILNACAKTLQVYGVTILDCGLASTPAMFMSTIFSDTRADGAVMITASHLPKNRNGLKFFTRSGGLEKGDITEILEHATSEEDLQVLHGAQKETIEKPKLMDRYAAYLRKLISERSGIKTKNGKVLAGLKIAVDAGNGSGGFFAQNVLEPLGADITASRYLDPDGSFPNHPANPENKEAMDSIREAVLDGECDLGLIFDTDVDRSAAVDETGRELSRNGIVAMASALIADKYPGCTVVTDSITSEELTDYLEQDLGLRHFRYQRGYRNVINKAKELNEEGTDAELAIETSGHAAFKDNYWLDDGAYLAALIVIKTAILKREGKTISSVVKDLKEPKEAKEIRMKLLKEDMTAGDRILASFEQTFQSADQAADTPAGLSFTVTEPNYEGVRVSVSGSVHGWFLLRKSLHDPILPLNIEAEEEGGIQKILPVIRKALSEFQDILDLSGLTEDAAQE